MNARFIVDRGSFGPEGGKSWIVWDTEERRIVDWPKRKRDADREASRLNDEVSK